MTVRIGIIGAAGRMGRMLAEAIAASDTPARLTAAIERPESTLLGADMGDLRGGEASGVLISSDLLAVADQIDVLIDFTVPESTLTQAAICAERGLPMVVGTTGFSDEQAQALATATAGMPFCQASNFAPGGKLTFKLAEAAAKAAAYAKQRADEIARVGIDPSKLLMGQAQLDDYRAKVEEMEVIAAAKAAANRGGDRAWEVGLRGGGAGNAGPPFAPGISKAS